MPLYQPVNSSITQLPGTQSSGGIVQPYDLFSDFIVQGFKTPAGASLTGTMSTLPWPGGSNAAVAYAGGHRVVKIVGDSALTFTYTANRDTYNDIDYNGTITHTAVTNGAAAPTLAANSLRLEKVVTNAGVITSVVLLAPTTATANITPTRSETAGQIITAGGALTLVHGLSATPKKVWYDLICVTAELGYSVGQRLVAQSVTGKNGAGPGLTIVPDATNLNIRFNNGSPVFQICRFDTGAQVNITNANWRVIFYSEL